MSENQEPNEDAARLLDNLMCGSTASLEGRLEAIHQQYLRWPEQDRVRFRHWVREMAKYERPKRLPFGCSIEVVISIQVNEDEYEEKRVSLHMLNEALMAWEKGEDYFASAWTESMR